MDPIRVCGEARVKVITAVRGPGPFVLAGAAIIQFIDRHLVFFEALAVDSKGYWVSPMVGYGARACSMLAINPPPAAGQPR